MQNFMILNERLTYYIQNTNPKRFWGFGSPVCCVQQNSIIVKPSHDRFLLKWSLLSSSYQEEKKGFRLWNVWVNALLRWTIRPCVPPWFLSTTTRGICTSCRGLFPSLSAWVRLSIWKGGRIYVSKKPALSETAPKTSWLHFPGYPTQHPLGTRAKCALTLNRLLKTARLNPFYQEPVPHTPFCCFGCCSFRALCRNMNRVVIWLLNAINRG